MAFEPDCRVHTLIPIFLTLRRERIAHAPDAEQPQKVSPLRLSVRLNCASN